MFFYREISNVNTDPYFGNVSLLLRGTGTQKSILDESSNPVVTTIVGDTSLSSTTKKYGSYSMVFDGSGDYLTIPAGSQLEFGSGDFTIEFWYYTSSTARQWFFHSSTDYWLGLDVSDRRIGMWASSNGGNWNLIESDTSQGRSTNQINLNTWNHIAFTRSGNNFRLFINGNLEKTVTASGAIVSRSAQTKRIGIHANNNYSLNGYLDDFRVTKGVARYTANFTPPTEELPGSSPADPYYVDVTLLLRGTGSPATTINDESTSLVATTIFGNTSLSSAIKKYGSYSMAFDGNQDYLTIPAGSQLEFGSGDFTIEFWYYTSSTARQWFFHSSTDYWLGLDQEHGKFGMWASSNGTSWNLVESDSSQGRAINAITINAWNHIAFTRSGNNFRLFVNGNLEKTVTASGAIVSRSAQTKRIGIHANNNYSLNGYLDDFRVTKGVARYTANFTPPTEELPAS